MYWLTEFWEVIYGQRRDDWCAVRQRIKYLMYWPSWRANGERSPPVTRFTVLLSMCLLHYYSPHIAWVERESMGAPNEGGIAWIRSYSESSASSPQIEPRVTPPIFACLGWTCQISHPLLHYFLPLLSALHYWWQAITYFMVKYTIVLIYLGFHSDKTSSVYKF